MEVLIVVMKFVLIIDKEPSTKHSYFALLLWGRSSKVTDVKLILSLQNLRNE